MKLSGSLLSAPALLAAVAIAEAQPHIQLSPALMVGCDQATYVNVASGSQQQLAAGLSGQGIYVCGWDLTASVNGTVTIENSPVSSCTTSVSASFTLQLSSSSPLVDHVPFYSGAMAAPAGNNLCVTASSSTVQGFVYWTQF